MKKQSAAAETAVTSAIKEVTDGVKSELKDQVLSAGLGQGFSRAWQSIIYPVGRKSINAAGWITTKAEKIIYAFNYGVTIRSAKGLFLAIPTSDAPKRGNDGKRINPTNFPEGSLGKLQFVYRPGKISLLVVDNPRSGTGRGKSLIRIPGSNGRQQSAVVMFFLVPQVSMKKKLDIESVVKKWEPVVPEKIVADWPKVQDQ